MKIAVFVPHRPQFGNITTQLPFLCALRREYSDAHIVIYSKSESSQLLIDCGAADELVNYKNIGIFRLISLLRCGNYKKIFNLYSGSERIHFSIFLSGVENKFGLSSFRLLDNFSLYKKHLYFKKGNQYIAENYLNLFKKSNNEVYGTEIVSDLLSQHDVESKLGQEITLIPGGGAGDFKRWSLDNYCYTALEIAKNNESVDKINIIIGPDERKDSKRIDELLHGLNYKVYDTPNISKLIEISRRSDLTLSNDCGPCHIFQMMKVPMIIMLGWKFDENEKMISSPYGVLQEWYYSNDNSWVVFPSNDKKHINSIPVEKVSKLALMQLEICS